MLGVSALICVIILAALFAASFLLAVAAEKGQYNYFSWVLVALTLLTLIGVPLVYIAQQLF